MNYLSVCSGIEAATVAWHPLGWHPVAFSEIEPFPCAVLKHHYPDVPNLGDMTKYKEWEVAENIDLLVGGTPCQSFSVAGLRKGLADPRGKLALVFLGLVDHVRPRWVVWENVPGVLSSSGGRDFGAFLGALAEFGYGFAYRVLDAKHFGCPIRRQRVFVVGHIGTDWRKPAAVLFQRKNFEYREKRSQIGSCGHTLTDQNCGSRNGRGNIIAENDGWRRMTPMETERSLGFPGFYTDIYWSNLYADKKSDERSEKTMEFENTIRNDKNSMERNAEETEQPVCNMRSTDETDMRRSLSSDQTYTRDALPFMQHKTSSSRRHGLGHAGMGLPGRKRITLDGPRYKALGNSMAVPVMRWIGQRIQLVEDIT
jgi:DNA (cytosine-5)-methyltransferase 1